jgi:acyl-CoA synthetase (NDP forming)
MGIINTLDGIKLNATFVAEKPETGSTGFLSQSGALGAAVLKFFERNGNKVCSLYKRW